MFNLRPYQQSATDAAKIELRASIEPVLIDAAPAAGKSYLVADLAAWLRSISGNKRVLCLQPNSKLVKQNVEKFQLTGERCSIFSASAGAKSTRHGVVYATPRTVNNSISRFTRGDYCGVIVDEAHELTPTIRAIIDEMRAANPNLRVIGLTGTPYRLNTGYIFRIWPDGKVNDDDVTRDPYFLKMAYRVSAREMLDAGFITPMEVVEVNAESYDTSNIVVLPNGTPDAHSIEQAFEGHGRRTAACVADVVAQVNARGVRGGVMLFAATVRHAHEILASLPPGNSALSTGDTGILMGREASDDAIVRAYRAGEFRYLVSVAKFTTGFDVDHTEFIATLRFTESAALLTQILGRAWRLHPDKPKCYWADYAGNHDRHFENTDIYNPAIKAKSAKGPGIPIEAECPDCGYINEFSLNPEYADFQRDKHGYCLDVFGAQMVTEYGPVASHYGRRCCGMVRTGQRGEYERCNHRYNSKECPQCSEALDIAARECSHCGCQVVDPNDALVAEFVAAKKDPHVPSTELVVSYDTKDSVSQKGNRTLRVDFVTSHKQFSIWLMPEPNNSRAANDWRKWKEANGDIRTISYVKDRDTNFYRVLAYNMPEDDLPDNLRGRKEVEKLRKYG